MTWGVRRAAGTGYASAIGVVTLAFVVFLIVHASIHLLGFTKAFGYAALPGLTVAISPAMGLVWLLAGTALLAASWAVYGCPRAWWLIGAFAVVVSMIAIVPSWADAKVGALANVVVLCGVVFGGLTYGPASLRAAYDRDLATLTATPAPAARIVTIEDLRPLPAPIREYLQTCGVVGQPRVWNVRVRMHGRIRAAPEAAWMPFAAEQHDGFTGVPARAFYLTATRALIPIQGYHRFVGPIASMRIIAAALLPVSAVSSEQLSVSETVTLFNDMTIFAPSTLLASSVSWGAVRPRADGAHEVDARYSRAGRTVSATIVIGADGSLRDFVSDDRSLTASDGRTMTPRRWSTPMRDARSFGPVRLASTGEGRWHDGQRSWAYLDITIDDVRYNVVR